MKSKTRKKGNEPVLSTNLISKPCNVSSFSYFTVSQLDLSYVDVTYLTLPSHTFICIDTLSHQPTHHPSRHPSPHPSHHPTHSVALQLDVQTNRILRFELLLSISTFVVTCGALVTGLFGMNLLNHMETDSNVFYIVAGVYTTL